MLAAIIDEVSALVCSGVELVEEQSKEWLRMVAWILSPTYLVGPFPFWVRRIEGRNRRILRNFFNE